MQGYSINPCNQPWSHKVKKWVSPKVEKRWCFLRSITIEVLKALQAWKNVVLKGRCHKSNVKRIGETLSTPHQVLSNTCSRLQCPTIAPSMSHMQAPFINVRRAFQASLTTFTVNLPRTLSSFIAIFDCFATYMNNKIANDQGIWILCQD